MIVMSYNDRRLFQNLGFFDYSVGKGLIYWYIAALPSVMDSNVDVVIVWWFPHVVLEEPEQWITKDVVVFVVCTPWCHNVPQVDLVTRERRL